MTELQRTPLYPLQAERGARFVPFAGWELPVQFQGVVAEHNAVRNHAGLFDVSHMGELLVSGQGAFDGLQHAITNDLARLEDGKALYTVICKQDGGIVDDLIIYREEATRFFVVVNASRRQEDFAHLSAQLEGYDCTIEDQSAQWAQLALQGPNAMAILGKLTSIDSESLPPFSFVDTSVGGVNDVRVARTGYTGEDGVELYCAQQQAPSLWLAIEEAGKDLGLVPCGLGARDTLRLEAKFALYGNDIDEQHTPLEAGLGWVVKLKKGDFVGREALLAQKEAGASIKLVGFEMLERGIPRPGYPLQIDGQEVGSVTSGTHSPTLAKPIGLGYLPIEHSQVGSRFAVVIRGKPVLAEVVKTPFYKRPNP